MPKVERLLVAEDIRARYKEINAFERELADGGVTVVKCFLHISPEVQQERLLARLDDPSKHWKYNPADIDVRSKWDEYQEAYTGLAAADTVRQRPGTSSRRTASGTGTGR